MYDTFQVDFNLGENTLKSVLKDKKLLLSLDFLGDIDARILAKCDLCQNDPCENGASCRPLPNRDYECQCAPGIYKTYL